MLFVINYSVILEVWYHIRSYFTENRIYQMPGLEQKKEQKLSRVS